MDIPWDLSIPWNQVRGVQWNDRMGISLDCHIAHWVTTGPHKPMGRPIRGTPHGIRKVHGTAHRTTDGTPPRMMVPTGSNTCGMSHRNKKRTTL